MALVVRLLVSVLNPGQDSFCCGLRPGSPGSRKSGCLVGPWKGPEGPGARRDGGRGRRSCPPRSPCNDGAVRPHVCFRVHRSLSPLRTQVTVWVPSPLRTSSPTCLLKRDLLLVTDCQGRGVAQSLQTFFYTFTGLPEALGVPLLARRGVKLATSLPGVQASALQDKYDASHVRDVRSPAATLQKEKKKRAK